MQRPAVNHAPLSPEEFALIDRATNKFRINMFRRYSYHLLDEANINEINYDIRAFANELKDLMLHPEEYQISEIGKLIAKLSDTDRLLLVKYRPNILIDCYDLISLLRDYIPLESRTLFACALVELMYRDDSEYMMRNIKTGKELLPEEHQEHYVSFCMKVMRNMDSPAINHEVKRSAKYFTSALILSALGHCTSGTLAPLTRKVSAVGAVYLILKGIYRLNEKMTFWQQVSDDEVDSPSPSPSPEF